MIYYVQYVFNRAMRERNRESERENERERIYT